jgi:hypothetical protein
VKSKFRYVNINLSRAKVQHDCLFFAHHVPRHQLHDSVSEVCSCQVLQNPVLDFTASDIHENKRCVCSPMRKEMPGEGFLNTMYCTWVAQFVPRNGGRKVMCYEI